MSNDGEAEAGRWKFSVFPLRYFVAVKPDQDKEDKIEENKHLWPPVLDKTVTVYTLINYRAARTMQITVKPVEQLYY